MNESQNREEATRTARYDMSEAIKWIESQTEPKPPANPSSDEIELTSEWLYNEGGDVDVDTTLNLGYSVTPTPITMYGLPILDFGDAYGEWHNVPAGAATENVPINVTNPDPLYGTYDGTITGRADIPAGADRELFTTFENVSASTYSKLVDTFTTEDGLVVDFFAPYVRVRGDVGASSGSVSAYLEEDIYYFQGSGSVSSDGSFDFEFKKPNSYSSSSLRLRHSSTREWSPGIAGEYIYSDYVVNVGKIIDQKYTVDNARVFVDGDSWSTTVTQGATDAVFEIVLEKNGTQVDAEWRRAWQGKDVLADYTVKAKQVSYGAPTDETRVAADGDFIIASKDRRPPFRVFIEKNGTQYSKIWTKNANNGNQYDNLYVTTVTVADTFYEIDRVPVPLSGNVRTWKETQQHTVYRLVYNDDPVPTSPPSPSTVVPNDRILAVTQSKTAMPISYDVPPEEEAAFNSPFGNRAYTYDIALALLVYVFDEDFARAEALADVLIRLQRDDGMFVFFASQGQYSGLTPYERTGAAAWADYALAKYVEKYPGAGNAANAEAACRANLDRIIANYEVTDTSAVNYGLYKGGVGRYTPNDEGVYTFDPNYEAPWVATEHTVDMFFAFQAAANAFGDAGYDARADDVYDDAIRVLWSDTEERFLQGATATGKDTRGALDCHTWGSVMLNQFGDIDRRDKALARLPVYRTENPDLNVYGYPPYTEEEGHYTFTDEVWFEGTYGAVHALRRAGREAEGLALGHQMSAVNQDPFNSYAYAVRGDALNAEVVDYPAMASTTWAILAMEFPEKMWSETP